MINNLFFIAVRLNDIRPLLTENRLITNVLGKIVANGAFKKVQHISTEELKDIYFVEVADKEGVSTVQKLVVSN